MHVEIIFKIYRIYKGLRVWRCTVVDGGMEIKGSECESKHLNPIWIIKDSHSIPHYHDYMQIGRTNL